jgi:hypothetical protein
MKPVCTQGQPAPKGEPIFPGARYAHTARHDWEHPDVDVSEMVFSGGFESYPDQPIENAFRPVEHHQCRHCGGNLAISAERSPHPPTVVVNAGVSGKTAEEVLREMRRPARRGWI